MTGRNGLRYRLICMSDVNIVIIRCFICFRQWTQHTNYRFFLMWIPLINHTILEWALRNFGTLLKYKEKKKKNQQQHIILLGWSYETHIFMNEFSFSIHNIVFILVFSLYFVFVYFTICRCLFNKYSYVRLRTRYLGIEMKMYVN